MGNSKYLNGLMILGMVGLISFSGNAVAEAPASFAAEQAVQALPILMREASPELALKALKGEFGTAIADSMWVGGGAQKFFETYKAQKGSHNLTSRDVIGLKGIAKKNWSDQSAPFKRAEQLIAAGEKITYDGMKTAPTAKAKVETPAVTGDAASEQTLALSRVKFTTAEGKAYLEKLKYPMEPNDITAAANLAQLQIEMEPSYKLCPLAQQAKCKALDETGLEGFALHKEDGVHDLITQVNSNDMLRAQYKDGLGHPTKIDIKGGHNALTWKPGPLKGKIRSCYKDRAFEQAL